MNNVSARKYLISNAKTNFMRVGVSSLATMVLTPFIIRNIGLDQYSYVALTSFFVSFSGFFDLGLSKSLVYLLNTPSVGFEQRNEYLTAQGIIVLSICGLVLGTGLLAKSTGLSILGESLPITNPHYGMVMVSSFLVLVFTIFDQYQCAVLESFFLLQHVNYGVTIKVMTLNVLYVLNLFTWNSVSFYVFSSVISILFSVIYHAYIIHIHVYWKIKRPSKKTLHELCVQTFHFFRFSLLTSLYSSLPRLFMIYVGKDLSYIGVLDVVEKLSLSVINFCSSILRPLFSLTRNAPNKIARQLGKVMIANGGIGFLFIIVVVMFKSTITNYFFSHTTMDTAFIGQILILYSIGSCFLLMSQPLSFYLQGEGKVRQLSAAFLLNIVLFCMFYIVMKQGFHADTLLSLAVCNLVVSGINMISLIVLAQKSRLFQLKK